MWYRGNDERYDAYKHKKCRPFLWPTGLMVDFYIADIPPGWRHVVLETSATAPTWCREEVMVAVQPGLGHKSRD